MNYQTYKPSQALNPYIEKIYLLSHESYLAQEMELSSPASCYSAIVFNFGTPYHIRHTTGEAYLTPQYFVAGFSTHAFRIYPIGKVEMLGIIFKGTGLMTLFPSIDLKELINKRVDFEQLLGSEGDVIIEQLTHAQKPEERFGIIENYLLNRLQRFSTEASIADKAALMILRKRGMITMDRLAADLNVSPRHLRRVFNQRLGISPKLFARLKRFNYVNAFLTTNDTLQWQEFLIDGGFYDQAHFIKDFVEFCGKAPSAQLVQSRKLVELLEANG